MIPFKKLITLRKSSSKAICEGCNKSKRVSKKAIKLTSSIESEHDKIEVIYRFVAENYNQDCPLVALRPEQWYVDHLYKKKTGSAFEINMLLLQMLKSIDIQALYILTSLEGSYRKSNIPPVLNVFLKQVLHYLCNYRQ